MRNIERTSGGDDCLSPMRRGYLVLVVLLCLMICASADYWASSVGTNSTSWSIFRQSQNLSFNMTGSVEGSVSPVEIHGRTISPHLSYYLEVEVNDLKQRERTSALQGNYMSEEMMSLWSNLDNDVIINMAKPAGTDEYKIHYYEQWPASLISNKVITYSGKGINDRDFVGNNYDFAGSNLLYNQNLSKERRTVMWLYRTNATVRATDDAIILAEFQPTKYLGYLIRTHTTGIADLSYRQADSQYDAKRQYYPPISEGDEMYYGAFDLGRMIEMRSVFNNYNETDPDFQPLDLENELPCCDSRLP